MGNFDRVTGLVMIIIGLLVMVLETYLIIINPLTNDNVTTLFTPTLYWSIAIPIFIMVVFSLVIFIWIGYTMVRIPPPELMEFQDFGDDQKFYEAKGDPRAVVKQQAVVGAEPLGDDNKAKEQASAPLDQDTDPVEQLKEIEDEPDTLTEDPVEITENEKFEVEDSEEEVTELESSEQEMETAEEPPVERDIEEINGISSRIADRLREAGLDTIDKIAATSADKLTAIKGIGKKTAAKIQDDIN